MKFSVNKRDGPARAGEIKINKKTIKTPNLLFINTRRFKAPEFANLILSNQSEKTYVPSLIFSEKLLLQRIKEQNDEIYIITATNHCIIDKKIEKSKAKLFIVSQVKQLFNNPKKLTEFIIRLREKIGYQKVIYLPSFGDPSGLALLTYLSIDLFDSTPAIIAARNNTLLFENGKFQKEELEELPCCCPICSKLKKKPLELKFQEILNHNYFSLQTEVKHIRNAISIGEIRNLVENRIRANPHFTAILKNLDKNYYDFLEKRTPIQNTGRLIATTKESSQRPEIIRFQKRIFNRYKKPNSAKILLLLPCSAKKPYSSSKSHIMFKKQIITTNNPYVIHEVIVTSPLGIVPRELEIVYPAASYDIPVIGIWEDYEKEMIKNLLLEYLNKNKYEEIVAHLPKEIIDFIYPIIKKLNITCINHPTSQDSLEKLNKTLNEIVKKYDKVKQNDRAKEEIKSIVSYQFGRKIAQTILKNSKVKGKYPNRKIFENNIQLGMITKERGFISLTLPGAKKVSEIDNYYVEIYDDFKLIGSVFAPGVKNADTAIRVGDEVFVTRKKEIIAVGVAQMNGEEMIESTHGEAVKIRHRI